MNVKTSWSWPRAAPVVGLLVGALGISILWWSGIAFPIYPPPGIIILLAGTLFVGLAPWQWAPGIGAFLGLFVIVGFLISPTGIPYLLGQHGPAVQIGTLIEITGVLTALIAGLIGTQANYRTSRTDEAPDPTPMKRSSE